MVLGNIANSDETRKSARRYYPNSGSPPAMYTGSMKLRLKELRKAKDLTQRQVAEAAGMSVSYYTEIELGRKQINANRLEALARALCVTPHQIIARSPSAPTEQIAELLPDLSEDQQKVVLALVQSLAGKR